MIMNYPAEERVFWIHRYMINLKNRFIAASVPLQTLQATNKEVSYRL